MNQKLWIWNTNILVGLRKTGNLNLAHYLSQNVERILQERHSFCRNCGERGDYMKHIGGTINGECICYMCKHNFNYAAPLGSTEVQTPIEIAESVVATGNISGSEGTLVELEIIVKCPGCKTKNKTISTLKKP